MILYLAMRTDIYQGDEVWQACLGVFDNEEAAQDRLDDFIGLDTNEEGTLRHLFEIITTELNQGIYE